MTLFSFHFSFHCRRYIGYVSNTLGSRACSRVPKPRYKIIFSFFFLENIPIAKRRKSLLNKKGVLGDIQIAMTLHSEPK